MNDEEVNSGEEDNDALVFHILITEPLTQLKFVNKKFVVTFILI